MLVCRSGAQPDATPLYQLIYQGSSQDSQLLPLIRSTFIPNRVLLHFDPANPPFGVANVNGSVRSLVEELEKQAGIKENIRICENFTCGMPIESEEELKERLPLLREAESEQA